MALSPREGRNRRSSPGGLRRVHLMLITTACLTCLTTGELAASGTVSELAERLATLRGEVEELSEQIEAQKADTRGRLRSIASQKMDLEMQVQREELRVRQLRKAREEQLEEVEAGEEARAQLEPTIRASIDRVRASVERGLPFKVEERLAELDELERRLDEKVLPPERAGARLWQFVEDELRLTRESGLYRQTIKVGSEEMLADVARLGMVALYFKTNDGRVGHVRRAGAGEWEYVELTEEGQVEQIMALFDAFKKNIRVGYFELPNGLVDAPRGGAK